MDLSVQGHVDSGTFGVSSRIIPAPMEDHRQHLRRHLRQLRRALTPQQQRTAADQLCRRLQTQPVFLRSRHIALYIPNDGEIDPRPILQRAWKLGKLCYLPVLDPEDRGHLRFVSYTPDTPMRPNRFGIPEPISDRGCRAEQLDVVLMPLVGFDTEGGRLGMGGGFYDRTLAFRHPDATESRRSAKPCLIGLAHHCQQVEQLPVASWDIPLNAIATDKQLIVAGEPTISRNFR